MSRCFGCGEVTSEAVAIGDVFLCPNCVSNWHLCSSCGEIASSNDTRTVGDEAFCQRCYERYAAACEWCEEAYDVRAPDSQSGFCPTCAEDHFICRRCDCAFSYDDYNDDGLCTDCVEEAEGNVQIKPYHGGPDCGFLFHPNGRESLYFGVELETDEYKDRGNAAAALTCLGSHDSLFWLENDCSLSNGIEIITQPCSLSFHRDSFPWKEISKTVKEFGGKSQSTTTCGLHVHFSRRFFDGHLELYQLRLIYLFERFWNELVKFSRRDVSQLDHNANKYDLNLFDCSARQKVKELKQGFSRYQAVNITMEDTIEIRIFRGTLAVNVIIASLELVDFLVRLVKVTSTRKLQELTWSVLVQKINRKGYRCLPDYLAEKGL